METSIQLEPSQGWGDEYVSGADWARLQAVLDLVRREHRRAELSPERRDQMRERVLARLERAEARRRRWRAVVAGAAVLLVGLVLVVWWWSSGPTLGERRPGIRA